MANHQWLTGLKDREKWYPLLLDPADQSEDHDNPRDHQDGLDQSREGGEPVEHRLLAVGQLRVAGRADTVVEDVEHVDERDASDHEDEPRDDGLEPELSTVGGTVVLLQPGIESVLEGHYTRCRSGVSYIPDRQFTLQTAVHSPVNAPADGFMADTGAAAHMAQSDRLFFRADEELRDAVEDYQKREGMEHLSDATKDLVQVGLREQRSPILARCKDRVVEWANLLVVAGLVLFTLAVVTRLVPFAQGTLAAVVLLLMASMLLAANEIVRAVAGVNEVGVRVRDGVAALATVVGGRD